MIPHIFCFISAEIASDYFVLGSFVGYIFLDSVCEFDFIFVI